MVYSSVVLEVEVTALICDHCHKSLTNCYVCDKTLNPEDEIYCDGVGHNKHKCKKCHIKKLDETAKRWKT